MKFSQLFLLLVSALATGGCATYTKLRVTDNRHVLVSEWVARGPLHSSDTGGYSITAVERVSGPPYSVLSKYPEGLKTTVTGPHISTWRCAKPLWLYEQETH